MRRAIARSHDTLCLPFMLNCFPKQLQPFSFPPAIDEGSDFFTAWSTLVIVHLVDYSHSSGTDRFLSL